MPRSITNRIAFYCGSLFFLLLTLDGSGQKVKRYAPELFSTATSGAVCGFSPDGRKIYFVQEDTVRHNLVLKQATRKKGRWVTPSTLPFSGKYNDMGARLTPDGQRLFFSSDRPDGSFRENDSWNLWYADLQPSGEWNVPVPLQPLNDGGDECCPLPFNNEVMFSATRNDSIAWWIGLWNSATRKEDWVRSLNGWKTWQWPSHFDTRQNILFLNSMKRTDSHGMDDVYISLYRKDAFQQPINMGEPVNSEAYEDGAILSPNGKWLIFCRHATGQTPSQVMRIKWRPVYRRFKKVNGISD